MEWNDCKPNAPYEWGEERLGDKYRVTIRMKETEATLFRSEWLGHRAAWDRAYKAFGEQMEIDRLHGKPWATIERKKP